MITAFVDALKNPFVFSANITRETLNATLFGIRAGFGLSTFSLMLQPAIKDVSKIGLAQATLNWYRMYQGAMSEIDSVWDDIYNKLVKSEDGNISDEFKEFMTKKEMTKEIAIKDQNMESIRKQLMALYMFRIFSNEGFALSGATRYHNLYSNSNTSSFHNIIEFQSAVENRLEDIKERFDGYDEIFSSDFVFKEQLNSINILLKDLEALGLVELSVQSKNIYKAIESYISPYAGTTARRKVFRDVVRGLKMFYSTEFVNRVMSESGLDVRGLLKLAVNEFINVKDKLTEEEISNLLISSIYEQHFSEGDILKFNNMLAKDIWTKNALYSAWEDLYNDPETKKLAELLYLYSVVTQRSSSTGIHDLIAHAPAKVINSMYYTNKNGEQVSIDDFYNGINNETISFRDKDILDFIISVSSGDSDIVQRVGWFKGGSLASSKRGEPTIGYREFYSPFAPRTPLLISVDVTGEPREAVKVSAGDDALVYHKIGTVRYEKEGRKTNTNPTGKVIASRDVYIIDTQPVVRSIGSINIINLDKNEKIFDTKNPFEVEQLLNEVASKTPNVRDVIFNPSFKIRRDIVNKKFAERASLLGEMRNYTKSMSENYIIVDDSYGEDTVPGRALRSIRDHSGRENSVLVMRKPSLYSAELGSVMIDDLIERFSHGVYFELDPVDSALYQNIQSMKKYGVLIEGPVKSETGVVSKKQDVYSGYTITEIRQKLIEMIESGKKTGYQFRVEELRSPFFADEDFIDEMESDTPGEFAAAIENLMKC
jgi:hypothetical protein